MPPADSKIVGKEELVHLIAAKAKVGLKEADAVIDALTETVREEVAKGHQVRLIGFGSWKLSAVSARTIKSIRGGAPVHLPAGKRVSFTAGSQLSEAAKAVEMRQPVRFVLPLVFKGSEYLDQLTTISQDGNFWIVPGPPPGHLIGSIEMNPVAHPLQFDRKSRGSPGATRFEADDTRTPVSR